MNGEAVAGSLFRGQRAVRVYDYGERIERPGPTEEGVGRFLLRCCL
jgi:hypothetical protein